MFAPISSAPFFDCAKTESPLTASETKTIDVSDFGQLCMPTEVHPFAHTFLFALCHLLMRILTKENCKFVGRKALKASSLCKYSLGEANVRDSCRLKEFPGKPEL